jgi:hypothetical protein
MEYRKHIELLQETWETYFDALLGQGFYVYNITEGQGTTYTGLPITIIKMHHLILAF